MKRFCIFAVLILLSIPARAADEVKRLHALFDRNWETRLRENPLFATSVGRHEYDHRLPAITMADLERRQAQRKATLATLAQIDRSKLPQSEQVSYDIFKRQIDEGIESF